MEEKLRGFEPVLEPFRYGSTSYTIPKRATKRSAAYDMFSPVELYIKPKEKAMVFTNIKAYMQDNEVLIANIRSSMGIRSDICLVNGQGWIDADFFGNQSNDGNIVFCLRNDSSKDYVIKIGDRIGQVMFIPFLIADDDDTTEERIGGIGSTGK